MSSKAFGGPFKTGNVITCSCGKTHSPIGSKTISYYELGEITIVEECCGNLLGQAVIENACEIINILRQESRRLRLEADKMARTQAAVVVEAAAIKQVTQPDTPPG